MIIDLGLVAPVVSLVAVLGMVLAPREVLKDGVSSTLRYHLINVSKRAFDIVSASLLLVLLAPFLLGLAIVIKFDSEGPVFYRQTRIGVDRRRMNRRQLHIVTTTDRRNGDRRRSNQWGQPFELYKFRTMRQDAEGETGPVWAEQDDPRITRVGRFLRQTRLDELPQLVNVLSGSMSLVGPRPERPHFVSWLKNHIPSYNERLKTRPGITGLAQISNGYDSSIEDVQRKLAYDLSYISNMGVFTDLRILFKTIGVIVGRKGAR